MILELFDSSRRGARGGHVGDWAAGVECESSGKLQKCTSKKRRGKSFDKFDNLARCSSQAKCYAAAKERPFMIVLRKRDGAGPFASTCEIERSLLTKRSAASWLVHRCFNCCAMSEYTPSCRE